MTHKLKLLSRALFLSLPFSLLFPMCTAAREMGVDSWLWWVVTSRGEALYIFRMILGPPGMLPRSFSVCCCVLWQCVAVCCSVLQCVAVCCSVLQCVAMYCNVLQCIAVCCSVRQCVVVYCSVLQCVAVYCSVLQCIAVCCRVLQCVAVCCSVLQCVAVCCRVFQSVAATPTASADFLSVTNSMSHLPITNPMRVYVCILCTCTCMCVDM